MYKFFIKTILDFILSLIALLILFPIILITLLFLIISIKGNPFFYQSRPGKNGKLFKVVKFKTMNDKKDSNGKLLPDFERITPIGSFIRKYSLDELPQLINVLKFDMSLVGPRPLLPEYLKIYNDFQFRRHEMKPGITGWAQVNGRNAISWKQKFILDVWYIDNVSLGVDVKIILLTILKVVKSENINSSENTTVHKFTGNN